MKFSSSHHRFRLWWLRYLCLCSPQNIFLSLIEILPFSWIRRCLTFVCRAEGVGTIIGWSVFSLFILSSGSLLPLVVVFSLLVILPFVSRLLRKRDDSYPYSRSPQVAFLPLAEVFSILVSLPLSISLVCRAEKAWQWSLASSVNLPPQGDDEQ